METKWFKYTYVCTSDCDALIEYTMKAGYTPNVTEITCLCGSNATLLSVEDATIQPTNERQQMETVTETYQDKEIAGLKLTLEDTMKHVESQRNKINQLQSQVNRIIDNLTEDYWFNPNTDTETILSDICDILDYEPKKEISFTATFTVSGRYDIPMTDVEDFDLEAFLADTMSIDAYNGDVVIDDWSLENAEEC